jgi:hypothetical protein
MSSLAREAGGRKLQLEGCAFSPARHWHSPGSFLRLEEGKSGDTNLAGTTLQAITLLHVPYLHPVRVFRSWQIFLMQRNRLFGMASSSPVLEGVFGEANSSPKTPYPVI